MVSPLYLAGDFAVRDGHRLADPIREGRFNDLLGPGLPFYVGKIDYRRRIRLPQQCRQLVLDSDDFDQTCELLLDGKSLGCRAWSPYVWSLPEETFGEHELCLRITTSLLGAFDGMGFDRATHSLKPL